MDFHFWNLVGGSICFKFEDKDYVYLRFCDRMLTEDPDYKHAHMSANNVLDPAHKALLMEHLRQNGYL